MSIPSAATPSSPRRAARNTISTCPRFPDTMGGLLVIPAPPLILEDRRVDRHIVRGKRRHLSLLVGAYARRRHHDDELGLLLLVPRAAEERPQDRDVPKE